MCAGWRCFRPPLNVFVRDTRYVVESANLVLFWLVPIFYSSDRIPAKYLPIIDYNPVAAVVVSLRQILLQAQAPAPATLGKMLAVSLVFFAAGLVVFRQMKLRFYEHI